MSHRTPCSRPADGSKHKPFPASAFPASQGAIRGHARPHALANGGLTAGQGPAVGDSRVPLLLIGRRPLPTFSGEKQVLS
jgi:hypothetical protein